MQISCNKNQTNIKQVRSRCFAVELVHFCAGVHSAECWLGQGYDPIWNWSYDSVPWCVESWGRWSRMFFSHRFRDTKNILFWVRMTLDSPSWISKTFKSRGKQVGMLLIHLCMEVGVPILVMAEIPMASFPRVACFLSLMPLSRPLPTRLGEVWSWLRLGGRDSLTAVSVRNTWAPLWRMWWCVRWLKWPRKCC